MAVVAVVAVAVVMVMVMVVLVAVVVMVGVVVKVANMGDTRTIHRYHIIYTTILHQSYNQCHHFCTVHRIHIVALDEYRLYSLRIVFHNLNYSLDHQNLSFLLDNRTYSLGDIKHIKPKRSLKHFQQ